MGNPPIVLIGELPGKSFGKMLEKSCFKEILKPPEAPLFPERPRLTNNPMRDNPATQKIPAMLLLIAASNFVAVTVMVFLARKSIYQLLLVVLPSGRRWNVIAPMIFFFF